MRRQTNPKSEESKRSPVEMPEDDDRHHPLSVSSSFNNRDSFSNEQFSHLILDRYGFIQRINNSTRIPPNAAQPNRDEAAEYDELSQDDNDWYNGSFATSKNTIDQRSNQDFPEQGRTIDSLNSMTDINVLHRHELKWIDMFKNWPEYMDKRFNKVRSRCRKGIPPSVRGCAWRHLCGAVVLEDENPNYYFELVNSDKGDPKVLSEIQKDLHRSFPNHELFYNNGTINSSSSTSSLPRGQSDLFDLLKAFSLHDPIIGYCQALAPVASVLLMHLPAHQAFWVLVAMCRYYLGGYYNPGLNALKTDTDILDRLLEKFALKLHRRLRENGTEPVLFTTEWFLCLFSRSLPWAGVLRIWDAFFCEGVKILFKVAFLWIRLALDSKFRVRVQKSNRAKHATTTPKELQQQQTSCQASVENFADVTTADKHSSSFDSDFTSCEQQADILFQIKAGPIRTLSAEQLIHQIFKLPISDHDLYEANKFVVANRDQQTKRLNDT